MLLRTIDLYRDPRLVGTRRRLWHQFSAVDTRLLRPAPRRINGRLVATFACWTAVGIAGIFAAKAGARWAGGVLIAYGLVEALWAGIGNGYAMLGYTTGQSLHRLPLASRTVGELWASAGRSRFVSGCR